MEQNGLLLLSAEELQIGSYSKDTTAIQHHDVHKEFEKLEVSNAI